MVRIDQMELNGLHLTKPSKMVKWCYLTKPVNMSNGMLINKNGTKYKLQLYIKYIPVLEFER